MALADFPDLPRSAAVIASDNAKDELFNGYFASVSVIDDDLLPICDNVAVSSTIDNIRFDEAKVLVAMHVQTETKSFCRTRLSAVHTV